MSSEEIRRIPVQSLVVETNVGGLGVTICACGALLICDEISYNHIDNCQSVIQHYANQNKE